MGKMISYPRPDGQNVNGYLAEPAQAAGAPGIVVIQEWWGLNDQIKGVADKLAAVHVPESDAGVVWYGYPPLEYVDASKIRAPLLAHWATDDAAFAYANVATLEGKLRAAGVKYEFHSYDAKHAFANETADAKNLPFLKYDAALAELAWKRTMAFFATHLK